MAVASDDWGLVPVDDEEPGPSPPCNLGEPSIELVAAQGDDPG